jgi:2-dehydro-3-deoxyphosphooctonate aldolase (KDO 8-P synthase)
MFSGSGHPSNGTFFLIAGPCVIEDEEPPKRIAGELKESCELLGIPFLFKASYRKANRTKKDSFRGIGDEKALGILERIRSEFEVPVLTDVHFPDEVGPVAETVDVLQIPAFLCRQTELLEAAGSSGLPVNIKKGQFMGPRGMGFAIEKVGASEGQEVWLTERGNSFGYQDLIVDMRNIPKMQEHGAPVVLDITHSLQQPEQSSGITGGDPSMIGTIGKSGIAAGADGIFLETHPRPDQALSDGANMLELERVPDLLRDLKKIRYASGE